MLSIYKSIPEPIKDIPSEEDKMIEDDILTEFNLSTFFSILTLFQMSPAMKKIIGHLLIILQLVLDG